MRAIHVLVFIGFVLPVTAVAGEAQQQEREYQEFQRKEWRRLEQITSALLVGDGCKDIISLVDEMEKKDWRMVLPYQSKADCLVELRSGGGPGLSKPVGRQTTLGSDGLRADLIPYFIKYGSPEIAMREVRTSNATYPQERSKGAGSYLFTQYRLPTSPLLPGCQGIDLEAYGYFGFIVEAGGREPLYRFSLTCTSTGVQVGDIIVGTEPANHRKHAAKPRIGKRRRILFVPPHCRFERRTTLRFRSGGGGFP